MLVNTVWKVEKATEKREIAIRNVLAPPEAFYRCRKRFSASGSVFPLPEAFFFASGSVFPASGSDLPLSEARFFCFRKRLITVGGKTNAPGSGKTLLEVFICSTRAHHVKNEMYLRFSCFLGKLGQVV